MITLLQWRWALHELFVPLRGRESKSFQFSKSTSCSFKLFNNLQKLLEHVYQCLWLISNAVSGPLRLHLLLLNRLFFQNVLQTLFWLWKVNILCGILSNRRDSSISVNSTYCYLSSIKITPIKITMACCIVSLSFGSVSHEDTLWRQGSLLQH